MGERTWKMPHRCAKGKWNVRVLRLPSTPPTLKSGSLRFSPDVRGAQQTNPKCDPLECRLDLAGVLAFQISISRSIENGGLVLFKLVVVICVVSFDLLIGYALGKAYSPW